MTTPPDIPREIEDQLALYFDNQATPQVVQAIEDWVAQDPANAQSRGFRWGVKPLQGAFQFDQPERADKAEDAAYDKGNGDQDFCKKAHDVCPIR